MTDADATPASPAELPPLPEGLLCPGCGYDLRGLTSERCPECGFSLEAVRDAESRIAWTRRSERGWLAAYWATVVFVTRRTRELGFELVRPLSVADAERFRFVTILHAYLPFLIFSVAVLIVRWDRIEMFWGALKWPVWIALQAACLAWLFLATLVPGFFLCSRRWPPAKRDRVVTLSSYVSASLAWLLPASLFFAGLGVLCVWLIDESLDFMEGAVCGLAGVLGASSFLWWGDLIGFARSALRVSVARQIAVAVGVPLAWLAAGAATVLLVGGGLVYLWMMLTSLM